MVGGPLTFFIETQRDDLPPNTYQLVWDGSLSHYLVQNFPDTFQ